MLLKLKASVGLLSRKSGPKVKNNQVDVDLIRSMLIANGVKIPSAGRCDASLTKAITTYQKRIGFKNPDQVIDPNGKTFKKLAPKFIAQTKKDEKIVYYKITYRNEKLLVTKVEYERISNLIFKRYARYVDALASQHKFNLNMVREYEESAKVSNGFMTAITQALIVNLGRVKFPNKKIVTKSTTAVSNLKKAFSSKDLNKFRTAMPEAEVAIGEFGAEIGRFLSELIGSAGVQIKVAKFTSVASFAIVGAMAAPILVSGTALGATAAGIAAATGAGTLESASLELGKHLAGQKVTVLGSAKTVIIDGAVSFVTAGIGSKIKIASSFGDDLVGSVAPKLAKTVPSLTEKQLSNVLQRFIRGAGEEALKSTVKQAATMTGNMAKTGRSPTQKDFANAAENVMMDTLTGGVMKNITKFQKGWALKNKTAVNTKILPSILRKTDVPSGVHRVLKAKGVADALAAFEAEALKVGFSAAIDGMSGKEDANQLSKNAENAIIGNRKLRLKLEKAIFEEAKKL